MTPLNLRVTRSVGTAVAVLPVVGAALVALMLIPAGHAAGVEAAGRAAPAHQQGPPAALLDAVRASAARRTGVPATAVRVTRTAAQTWPDAGLGCPEPDALYAQVLTPGYLLLLQAGGRQLEYHTDSGQRFTLCRDTPARAGLPATGGGPAGVVGRPESVTR